MSPTWHFAKRPSVDMASLIIGPSAPGGLGIGAVAVDGGAIGGGGGAVEAPAPRGRSTTSKGGQHSS
eukprot:6576115-Pyramimonas_sp.AAC.1